jgi:hypothetical protein
MAVKKPASGRSAVSKIAWRMSTGNGKKPAVDRNSHVSRILETSK